MRSTNMRKLWLVLLLLLLAAPAEAQIDSNSIRLQDEGTTQGAVKILNCVGAGIACTRSAATGTLTVAGGGGADPWTYLQVNAGADFTTTSATAVDVTGLSFTPAANTKYELFCFLGIRTATTTVNPRVGLAWSTGLTDGIAGIAEAQTATTQFLAQGNISAALLIVVGGLPNTTGSWPVSVNASLLAGATPSGTTRIQLASETAGTTVRIVTAGSFCKFRSYTP